VLFFCAASYLALLYVRPGEIVPAWGEIPFLPAVAAASVLAGVLSWFGNPRSPGSLPTDKLLLGYWAVILVSNPVNGWMGGAINGFNNFIPVVFCYFLVRLAVQAPRDLKRFMALLVLLSLFQAVNGIVQHETGVGLGNVTALAQREVQDPDDLNAPAEAIVDLRIRGTGIFNDPNDLAMALILVVPFLLVVAFRRRGRLINRAVAAVSLAVLILAIYYTNSRGGTLGLAAAAGAFWWLRFRRRLALVATAVGLVVLILAGPSRMNSLNAEEASAQGRVHAWAAGLRMFAAEPIVGIGYTRFDERHERVAHNSFVHVVSELGFLGAACLVGLFYWFFRGLGASGKGDLDEVAVALRASGVGVLTCAMFLSRQYNVVPFVLLALGAARHALAAADTDTPRRTSEAGDWFRIVLATAGGIAATYVAVRTLAIWAPA
jgi:hypothetical protein